MYKCRRKADSENCCYYISNQLQPRVWGRRKLDPDDLKYAVSQLEELQKLYIMDVIAYCFMPTSFHIVVQAPRKDLSDSCIVERYNAFHDAFHEGKRKRLAPGDTSRIQELKSNLLNVSEFMRGFIQIFSRYLGEKHKKKGSKWNRRYNSLIVENSVALLACVRNIEQLPVHKKLCKSAGDYKFSSWGAFCRNGAKDYINNFVKYMQIARNNPSLSLSELADEFRAELKKPVCIPAKQWSHGNICGSKEFIESIEKRKSRLPQYGSILFLSPPRKHHTWDAIPNCTQNATTYKRKRPLPTK